MEFKVHFDDVRRLLNWRFLSGWSELLQANTTGVPRLFNGNFILSLFTFRLLQKYKHFKTVWHKTTDQKTMCLLLIACLTKL